MTDFGAALLHRDAGIAGGRAREADAFPDVVEVDVGVVAAVAEERDREGGEGFGGETGERFFEGGQAAHAEHGVELAFAEHAGGGLGALGNQHRIAEIGRLALEGAEGAAAARLAEQAELVVICRAVFARAEALREEEETTRERDAGDGLAPGFVVKEDGEQLDLLRIGNPKIRGEVGGHRHELMQRHRWRGGVGGDASGCATPQFAPSRDLRGASGAAGGCGGRWTVEGFSHTFRIRRTSGAWRSGRASAARGFPDREGRGRVWASSRPVLASRCRGPSCRGCPGGP